MSDRELNLSFQLPLRYQDAITAVKRNLLRCGFGVEECRDLLSRGGQTAALLATTYQMLDVYDLELENKVVEPGAARRPESLFGQVAVCATHGGFARVVTFDSRESGGSAAQCPPVRPADTSAIRLMKAILDAGRSAFFVTDSDS